MSHLDKRVTSWLRYTAARVVQCHIEGPFARNAAYVCNCDPLDDKYCQGSALTAMLARLWSVRPKHEIWSVSSYLASYIIWLCMSVGGRREKGMHEIHRAFHQTWIEASSDTMSRNDLMNAWHGVGIRPLTYSKFKFQSALCLFISALLGNDSLHV